MKPFDLLWIRFRITELTDSETSSSFGEGDKEASPVEYWMEETGRRILQQEAERRKLLQNVLPGKNEASLCMRCMRL